MTASLHPRDEKNKSVFDRCNRCSPDFSQGVRARVAPAVLGQRSPFGRSSRTSRRWPDTSVSSQRPPLTVEVISSGEFACGPAW